MKIAIPKDIKIGEPRVALPPSAVSELVRDGHEVVVETNAGDGIGVSDEAFQTAGAKIAASADEAYDNELIIKVKEPQPVEWARLTKGQTLFAYLHLAPDPELTQGLLTSGATAIAFETVEDAAGRLPILSPMSEVAGRLSIQAAAIALEKKNGGSGLLLGGVPGVAPAHVSIIGAGTVGTNAMQMAVGTGADVTVLDTSLARLREIDAIYRGHVNTVFASSAAVKDAATRSDVVVGAVLVPGASAPRLLSREDLSLMKEGSALVDVAIDQGGCF